MMGGAVLRNMHCMVLLLTLVATLGFHTHAMSRPRLPGMMMQVSDAETDLSPLSVARRFVGGRLGRDCPELIADDFSASGPASLVTGKKSYLSDTTVTAIYKAMPDLNLRAYAFQTDSEDPNTVWFKFRPEGSVSQPFVYKGEVYPPSMLRGVEFPVQQGSVTTDKNGQIVRLTTDYVIDRLTGNTNGLTGANGVLTALGQDPLGFSTQPVGFAIQKFFGRNRKPVNLGRREPPLPPAVMISLTKQVLATRFGSQDPSLLARNFVFSGPTELPLSKDEFLKSADRLTGYFASPDFSVNAFNFVIDEYDANRVWLMTRSSGLQYTAAPEVLSVSIDENGLCYKVTAGYVVDRESGNTNGLGGPVGYATSQGSGPSVLQARALPDAWRLFWIGGKTSMPQRAVPPVSKESSSTPAPKPSSKPKYNKIMTEARVASTAKSGKKEAAAKPPSTRKPVPAPKTTPKPPSDFRFGDPKPKKKAVPKPARTKSPTPPPTPAPASVVVPEGKAKTAPVSTSKKEAGGLFGFVGQFNLAQKENPKVVVVSKRKGGDKERDLKPPVPVLSTTNKIKTKTKTDEAFMKPAAKAQTPVQKRDLAATVRETREPAPTVQTKSKGKGLVGGLFGGNANTAKKQRKTIPAENAPPAALQATPKVAAPKSKKASSNRPGFKLGGGSIKRAGAPLPSSPPLIKKSNTRNRR